MKERQPKKETGRPQKRIKDEILVQIGKSVLLVFLVVAIVAIVMVRFAITSSRKSELTLDSRAAVNEMAGFLRQYTKIADQLAVSPQIRAVLSETKQGDNILVNENMDIVREYLDNIVQTDPDNFMTTWIADLDASVLTQSDG